jgi:uncharacterized surface protein with fasciclin (FAS1) repeats
MRLFSRSTSALAFMAVAMFATVPARAADIVDTAVAAGSFKTLVAAVKAADLVDTLKGKGPFTVFAPTDAAFAKLPKSTLAALLKPANKGKLAAILTYHVVPGKVLAKDLAGKVQNVKTVNGASVRVNGTKGVRVNASKVTKADIETSNGVIHVIDTVLLPPARVSAKASANAAKHH